MEFEICENDLFDKNDKFNDDEYIIDCDDRSSTPTENIKCGQVFVTESLKILCNCTLCDKDFKSIDYFVAHILNDHFSFDGQNIEDEESNNLENYKVEKIIKSSETTILTKNDITQNIVEKINIDKNDDINETAVSETIKLEEYKIYNETTVNEDEIKNEIKEETFTDAQLSLPNNTLENKESLLKSNEVQDAVTTSLTTHEVNSKLPVYVSTPNALNPEKFFEENPLEVFANVMFQQILSDNNATNSKPLLVDNNENLEQFYSDQLNSFLDGNPFNLASNESIEKFLQLNQLDQLPFINNEFTSLENISSEQQSLNSSILKNFLERQISENNNKDNKNDANTQNVNESPQQSPIQPDLYTSSEESLSTNSIDNSKNPPTVKVLLSSLPKLDSVISSEAELPENSPQLKIIKKLFECKLCGKFYKNERAYKRHQSSHQNDSPNCPHCRKYFQTKKHYLKHNQQICQTRQEKKNNSFRDPKEFLPTEEIFDSNNIFLNDGNNCKPLKRCKFCTKTFTRDVHLKLHEKSHETLYKCEHCPRTFFVKNSCVSHMRIHTGEKPFKCSKCPAAFSTSSNLKAHVIIHTVEKPFVCTFGCGKAFHLERFRNWHERIHTGEKPYQCDLCGNKFAIQSRLSLHRKQRHMDKNDRPHKCEICLKKFLHPNALRAHLNIHSGAKPFCCDFNGCEKRFPNQNRLWEHKKIHSGHKKHVCKICAKSFAQYAGLAMHKKCHNVNKN